MMPNLPPIISIGIIEGEFPGLQLFFGCPEFPIIKTTLIFLILRGSFVPFAVCETTRVGVVAPLSGGSAASGETVRNSVELASSEFNHDRAVTFLFEDDQLAPKNTVSAVTKCIEVDNVNGLIVFGSPTSLAVNSIAERRKVPMIALSIVDRVVSGKDFIVKHWVPSRVENDLIVREVKNRGYKRIALVATTNDAMLALRDHFSASKAADIVLSEDVSKEEIDFRSLVSRIVNLKPDATYILLWAPQPGLFAKKLRQAGYMGELFGVHNLEDPNEIANSQGALDGAWFVTGNDSAGEHYFAAYKAKFGKIPTAGGLNAFDAAKLMIEGIRTGNLNKYLHTTKSFKGAYGTYDASGMNDFTIEARIKKVQAGEFKAIEQSNPADRQARG